MAAKLGQAFTAAQLGRAWSKSQILEAYSTRCRCAASWWAGRGSRNPVRQTGERAGRHRKQPSSRRWCANAAPERVAQRAQEVLKQQTPMRGPRRDHAGRARTARRHAARRATCAALRAPLHPAGAPRRASRTRARNACDRRVAPAAGGARAATSRTAPSSCSTTSAARRWPGSVRTAPPRRPRRVDGVLRAAPAGLDACKPFVYELAFERRPLTPASLLDDSPAQIATAAGLYLPQNYDRDFKGWVSVRTALGASPERAGGAHRRDARAGCAVRAPERLRPGARRERRLPRSRAGAGSADVTCSH